MKTASTTYKNLKAIDTSWFEWRVLQSDKIYELDKLKSIGVSFALTSGSGIDIGNANAAECRMTLLEESANWQRMAAFTIQFRICSANGGTKSEWITLGKFYTDERSEDDQGNLSIIAFDGMLKLEQTWADKIPSALLPASYPITARAWATMVDSAGLADFEDLTQLDNTVEFIGLNTTATIRDVLKSIAATHAGNWVMTTTETLNLIPFANVDPEETETYFDLQLQLQQLEHSPALSAVTGVHLETQMGAVMESGSSSGYIVKSICDVSRTTGVAELCLDRIEDYVFKPFKAGIAYLDPCADIGDSVKIDDTIYQIMLIDWTLGKSPTADVSAPYDNEIDHEYTVPDQETKTYRKAMSMVGEKMDDYVPWDEFATAIEQNEQAVVIAASHTYVTQQVYDAQITEIQSQLDGSIQTWSGNAVPTLNNAPAVNWITPTDKATHVGDTYFVNSDAGIPEAGNYYRFEVNNGVYSWQLLTDSVLTEALAQAAAAQAAAEAAQSTANTANTTAQSKGRIFVVQPTPPYDVGDLWFNSTDSVIKVCMTAKSSGSYAAGDWVKRDNYTDLDSLEAYLANNSTTINSLRSQLDQKAETYYQSVDPAVNWGVHPAGIAIAGIDVAGIPTALIQAHIGDLWYKTTDSTTWFFDGSNWVQQDVPDDVFDMIDGKAQIFVGEPYPPYNQGDLWFNSDTSDIMTCMISRASGDFVQTDWQKRNKYTDDSTVNTFIHETYESNLEIQNNAISAKVSKIGGTNSSFGWVLNDTSHTWYSGNQEVMKVSQQSGLVVKGNVTATTGYIGSSSQGFEITASAIRNGMTSLSDNTHNGVYIGTDGIALGQGKFKVTSSGAVSASNLSISGGSIQLGYNNQQQYNFQVTSAGVITATSGTVGGMTLSNNAIYTNGQSSYSGSGNGIYIGANGLRIGSKFSVDNEGNLRANSATFEGNIYAKNISYGGNAGYLNGAGITDGTITGAGYSGTGGKLAPYTLGDYNVARSGGYGAYSSAAFTSDVQGGLYGGTSYTKATRQTGGEYPAYFAATAITALSSFYSPSYAVDNHGNDYELAGHYHTVTVAQDGTVQFGQPTNTRPDPFNIADTKTYQDGVKAVTVSSRAVLQTNVTNYTDYDGSAFDCDMTGSSYHYESNGILYGRLEVRNSSGSKLKRIRVKLPASSGEGVPVGGVVLSSNSSSYNTYTPNFDFIFMTSDVYKSGNNGYIRIKLKDSNGGDLQIIRALVPMIDSQSVTSLDIRRNGLNDWTLIDGRYKLPIRAYAMHDNVSLYNDTQYVDIQDVVNAAQGSQVSWVQIMSSDYSLAGKQVDLYCYDSNNNLVYSNYNVRITYDDR